MAVSEVYSRDSAIAKFFEQTCTTCSACETKALELVGGSTVTPVEVQGACSYTVYAGPQLEHVVQFRLDTLQLDPSINTLARQIHGSLVPRVEHHRTMGEKDKDKETEEILQVYVMDRVKGLPHLDFILAHGFPENSDFILAARRNLMTDIARFLATSWNAPQKVAPEHRSSLHQEYSDKLHLLLSSLPERFHTIIQTCINQLDPILSLPMVLTHCDFGASNVLVADSTCHLTGVIDWAEAKILPFGRNLHAREAFTGALHLRNGWRRYEDYHALHARFWNTFGDAIGKSRFAESKKAIQTARVVALLLSRGFKKELGNGAFFFCCNDLC